MQILLANAKIMNSEATRQPMSQPIYQQVANELAAEMATLSIEQLARQLDCSHPIAAENWKRYQQFHCAPTLPAIMAYNGQAYKHLRAASLSDEVLTYGQHHLWITCFLYGLLRPMDGIVPYRMEHCVKLLRTHEEPVNRFWKPLLTERLIESVKADDGLLVHLSTAEYEHLFDWKRVKRELTVIEPLFYVRKQGKLRMQAVWSKSCRGAMTRFLLCNRIHLPQELTTFCYKGFEYQPQLGDPLFPHFVRED